jgi:serine/threonine protein kinase
MAAIAAIASFVRDRRRTVVLNIEAPIRAFLDADEFRREYPSYRLLQLLSLDASTAVVRARQFTSGRNFVIKQLLHSKYERELRFSLFNEAHFLNLLGGQRVPDLVEVKTAPSTGLPYLVMTEVRGQSLERKLLRLRSNDLRPTIGEILDLLDGLAETVETIHRQGIVHGDITPANVIAEWRTRGPGRASLRPSSLVYLVDFDAAEFIDQGDSLLDLKFARGTVGFMAPERLWRTSISASSDVYSCTALAAFLFTGRARAPGTRASDRIPTSHLVGFLRRGLNVDPSERPTTMRKWRIELRGISERLSESKRRSAVDWPRSMPIASRRTVTVTATEQDVRELVLDPESLEASVPTADERDRTSLQPSDIDVGQFSTVVGAMRASLFEADRPVREAARLYGQGFSVAEIAKRLERSPSRVRRALQFAQDDVESRLEKNAAESSQASSSPSSPLASVLSERELEIVRLMSEGATDREIAKELHISAALVRARIARIRDKIGIGTRSELAEFVRETQGIG